MDNTKQSFLDKWNNNPKLAFDNTLKEGSEIFNWILKRNGFKNKNHLIKYLANKTRILDAGCGNGRVTALLSKYSNPLKTEIVGIDLVASNIAKKNFKDNNKIKFYKKNILDKLNDLGKFDFVYCQEVLHHTKIPKKAFINLCSLLTKNGEIAIYVYKKKAPIREYVDDYIRKKIENLSYIEAIKVCEQITKLGYILSQINAKITVPQIDSLEISKGKYDLQRFLYHFFIKCYWNPELSFKDNVVINYDWYHPQICIRYQPDVIRNWFNEAGLKIIHENIDHYGITIRGKRI